MFRKLARNEWGDNPYAVRTWFRGHLPWWVIDLGFADKGEDCEKVGGEHHWYNHDGKSSHCYHCEVEREGRLWETSCEEA